MKLISATISAFLTNGVLGHLAHSEAKSEALTMLRVKRGNEGVFEEIKAGNMERECIEESCSKHEFDEVLDLDELSGAELSSRTRSSAQDWKKLTNRCSFRPCDHSNTKTCKNEWNNYKCICKPGWGGAKCEDDIDECVEQGFCKNGGSCENEQGGFDCDCAKGWTGDNCELDVDECLDSPCSNGGSCTNTDGDFICECATGWTGATCEEDINECEVSDPCMKSNQYCINEVGSFKCACRGGYTGNDCDEDLDECTVLKPCKFGAVCATPEFNSFTCSCPDVGCNNYVEDVVVVEVAESGSGANNGTAVAVPETTESNSFETGTATVESDYY